MNPGNDSNGDRRTGPSRRWLLIGGAAALAGAGAGVGAGFLQPGSDRVPKPAPAALVAALAAERELLALGAAAARRDPALRAAVAGLTADHAAHLRAVQSALAGYDPLSATPTPTPTLTATPSVQTQVRAAERAAAAAAASRAGRLTGAVATLLASIAACESSHVELLA